MLNRPLVVCLNERVVAQYYVGDDDEGRCPRHTRGNKECTVRKYGLRVPERYPRTVMISKPTMTP